MSKKKIKNLDAREIADNAIGFVKVYPCSICTGEDGHTHKCWIGYKRRGSCPIYKELTKRLEVLK